MIKGPITVRPWADDVIDVLGHDPRSPYAEKFWLGLLGPSTAWMMRRLAAGLEERPDGFDTTVSELARSLGLGTRGGASSSLERAVERARWFDLARLEGGRKLAVRRRLPPLTRHQVLRLPAALRAEHQRFLESQPSGLETMRRRCRQLALSLIELGEDAEATERQLLRWRYHPALAHESAAWAVRRHRQAEQAAAGA